MTAQHMPSPQAVRECIHDSLHHLSFPKEERKKQVAFYGGSFTSMNHEVQISYLSEVQPFVSSGMIDSIRLSTRPDGLSEETLTLLKGYGVKTIEVGVQSMVDDVLLRSERGHTAKDSSSAILRLKERGFEVGVHLMVGLPGDSCDQFLNSLDQIINLKPNFVRIHPTLVLKGTTMEELWKLGEYSPLTLEEAIQWLKKGVLQLEKASIPIARIGLQPTKELEENLLAGPFHPALHQLVESALFYDMAEVLLQKYLDGARAVLICHPKDLSNLKGQKNTNLITLKERFGLQDLRIEENKEVRRGSLLLKTSSEISCLDRMELADSDINRGLKRACSLREDPIVPDHPLN